MTTGHGLRPVVIGGGPAGLTAAYELAKHGHRPCVIEKLDKVGGLSRTENYQGYHFDLGGHRFFTKSEPVQQLWHEVLEEDFLERPRLSRIYYKKRFFFYPLKPVNAFLGLGPVETVRILFSYLRWRVFPYPKEDTFEQWVTNRFGRRLFLTFFKTYTEKVWGIPCTELRAEWAAQRIKNLSLKTALTSMFLKPRNTIKTLIEKFDYPRLGPGMMWNAFRRGVERNAGTVQMDSDVVRICRTGTRIDSVEVCRGGQKAVVEGTHFLSSMPLTEFIKKLDPPPPADVLDAAARLKYRDFLTVCLIVNKPDLFPDNWLYIHDPEVRVGRIQNFKNWSPDMVPDANKSSLGLEYFCTEGDDLWTMSDDDLVALGKKEVDKMGLAAAADVEGGCVIRVQKSYPIYDADYREHLDKLRAYVEGLENFQTIGRNGLHRYNNQDHAMLTGILAVRNLLNGERNDLWNVNADQEYHEEVRADAKAETVEALAGELTLVWGKLGRVALGTAVGAVTGLALLLMTLLLVLKGGEVVGPHLGLLGQYFPGYSVSGVGALVGLFYGFVTGFAFGWGAAFLRNGLMYFSLARLRREADRRSIWRMWDYL